jgi:hypothetical protein
MDTTFQIEFRTSTDERWLSLYKEFVLRRNLLKFPEYYTSFDDAHQDAAQLQIHGGHITVPHNISEFRIIEVVQQRLAKSNYKVPKYVTMEQLQELLNGCYCVYSEGYYYGGFEIGLTTLTMYGVSDREHLKFLLKGAEVVDGKRLKLKYEHEERFREFEILKPIAIEL